MMLAKKAVYLMAFVSILLIALPACADSLGNIEDSLVSSAAIAGDEAAIEQMENEAVGPVTSASPAEPAVGLNAGPGPDAQGEEIGPNAGAGPGPVPAAGSGPGGPADDHGNGEGAGPGPQAGLGIGEECQAEGDCQAAVGPGPGPNLAAGPGPGAGSGTGEGCPGCVVAGTSKLTDDEIAALLYMREEEKLAGDVYDALFARWGLQTFANIAQSERTHEASILQTMAVYEVADPAAGNAPGVFNDAALQELYDQLVARGTTSISEALRVGAAVEEIDILDLQQRLGETQTAALIQTFTNLLRGSENHLRAFVRALVQQTGEGYSPQYLEQAAYDAIMAAQGTGGNGNGPGGSPGGQGGQGGRAGGG